VCGVHCVGVCELCGLHCVSLPLAARKVKTALVMFPQEGIQLHPNNVLYRCKVTVIVSNPIVNIKSVVSIN
jgi:hypothetical protein